MKDYKTPTQINVDDVTFELTLDRRGAYMVSVYMGKNYKDVAILTPACVTQWPRCTGDGNFGTNFGPTDEKKTKFTLDLTSLPIADQDNTNWDAFAKLLTALDDKLLEFCHANSQKLFKKSLTKEMISMLQIRTVRDKNAGGNKCKSVELKRAKYSYDALGFQAKNEITICDATGNKVGAGEVRSGDVVSATMYIGSVYTGVGGDKFGIQWSFDAVSVVCQREKLERKPFVSAFANQQYTFVSEFEMPA